MTSRKLQFPAQDGAIHTRVQLGEGLMRLRFSLKNYWQLMAAGGKSSFFS